MPVGIVTGASRGLGLALARELAKRDWTLVLDARGADVLQSAAAGLNGAVPVPGDVSDAEHRRALVEAAGDRIDLVVSNASLLGPSPQPPLAEYPLDELATNTVRHGGGRGKLRIWREPEALICEVSDAGRLDQPLAGRERPLAGQPGGRGLWLVNQLCDLAQIRCYETGSVVRLHMRL